MKKILFSIILFSPILVKAAGDVVISGGGTGTVTIQSGGGSGSGDITDVNAGYGITVTNPTGPAPTVNLGPDATGYVQVRETLQTGATFFVSSGTVDGQLSADILVLPDPTSADGLIQIQSNASPDNNPIMKVLASNLVWTSTYRLLDMYYGSAGGESYVGSIGWNNSGDTGLAILNSAGTTKGSISPDGLSRFEQVQFEALRPDNPDDITASVSLNRDSYFLRVDASAAGVAVTLPDVDSLTGIFKHEYIFCKTDSSTNTVTFVAGAAEDTAPSNATLTTQNECVVLISSFTGGSDAGQWYLAMKSAPSLEVSSGTFIQVRSSLQSGATFFVSSGTVSGTLTVGTDAIVNGQSVCLENGTNCQAAGSGDAVLAATQTFTGGNTFSSPLGSTVTYGMVMGTATVTTDNAAFSSAWDGSKKLVTENAVYDNLITRQSSYTFITYHLGGSTTTVLPIGTTAYVYYQYGFNVSSWTLIGDTTGSIQIDLKTCVGLNCSNLASIAGSELPTLSSTQVNNDAALTTWTNIANNSKLAIVPYSASTIKSAILQIWGWKQNP